MDPIETLRKHIKDWLIAESTDASHFARCRESYIRLADRLLLPNKALTEHMSKALTELNERRFDDESIWFHGQLSEDIGAELVNQLAAVLTVRAQRRKHYGDSYQSMDPYELLIYMRDKLRRYYQQLEPENSGSLKAVVREGCASVAADSLRDLINYALFALVAIDRTLNQKMEETKP